MLVGAWRWDIYEEALAAGFRANGWSIAPFILGDYLSSTLAQRIQARVKTGPAIVRLNDALLKMFGEQMPDAVFFYSTDLVMPTTLKRMKTMNPRVVILTYHNDNPFVGWRNRIKWRHYLKCVPAADITLVYRPSNVEDARRYGARQVSVLPPYCISYVHRPLPAESRNECSDVLFVGHYEPDGRASILDFLMCKGINVRVCGAYSRWREAASRYSWVSKMNIHLVWGDEYARLLSSAKIALVFLSHANRDVWTRRCFEIPACGTLMVAPRTPELEQLFEDGSEAIYYDSREDLLQKIRYYLDHDEERQQIALAGRDRCMRDGHSEVDRARQIIAEILATKEQSDNGIPST